MSSYKSIGECISVIDNRNSDGRITRLLGLSIDKCYIPSVANIIGTDLKKYKVLRKGQFACSLMQVSRDQKVPIAMYADEVPAIISPAYITFNVSVPNVLLPEYLDLWFKRVEFDREATFYAIGGVRGSLDWEDFCNMRLPVPSISEQCRIVRAYHVILERIELLQKINRNIEEQAKALFQLMFIDRKVQFNWKTGTFSDLIDFTRGGDWGKESPIGNNSEMVYCIRGADIPEVKKGDKGKMPTRYILPKNYVAKRLLPGDIVVEISGGSPTQSTGRVAAISQSLLDRYDKGMVCTNFCRAIKPKAGYSMFIYYYWQYLYDRNVFFSFENGTTGIKNLDLSGFITTEEIIIPPVELVEQFDEFCQGVFNCTFSNGLENEKLASLRDILLPQLMSGELDVTELDI